MRSRFRALLAAGLALALVGCGERSDEKTKAAVSADFATLMDETATAIFRENPELATARAVSEAIAGGPFAGRLSDSSAEGLARQAKLASALAARFAAIDPRNLSPADAISHRVVSAALADAVAGARFGYGNSGLITTPTPYVLSQLTGAYQAVPDFLDTQHPIRSAADAEAYLARLDAFATVIDQETARFQADAGKGATPPGFVIDRTLEQLRAFAGQPAPATLLVRSLQTRAPQAAGVTPVQAVDFTRRAITAVRDRVQPALQRQIAALEAARPRAPSETGVGRLPQGAEYYRTALRAWTTSDLSPDAIHKMGLDLVARFTAELDQTLKAQGMTEGSVGARVQTLAQDPRQLYADTDADKRALIDALNRQIETINAKLPDYFGVRPRSPLEIRRVPKEIQRGAPGGYYQAGAPDGSRPGIYYINLRNTAEWPRFTLPTLTYHEGVPGHHLQISTAQETTSLHILRSAVLGFSGYTEGWGLYAEQLADEMGMYADDPAGRVGYLQSMIFRAARLVVDTGIHAKGWSREQAVAYVVSVTGDRPSSIETEIERYAVWPGQACAYMVGRETINRLRDRAKADLGARFDIRAFHDRILSGGAMPLSVLETDIAAWIAAEKSR